MSRKHWLIAIGASAVLLLLLRKKGTAAAAAAAPASSLEGGFTTLGIASIYFDPGQTFDINANANSPDFGKTIN